MTGVQTCALPIFSLIAAAQVKAGELEGARRSAALAGSKAAEARVLVGIASVALENNQTGWARETLDSASRIARDIDPDADRAQVLSYVSSAHIKAGNLKAARDAVSEAVRAVEKISLDDKRRDATLSTVASAVAKTANVPKALDLAGRIGSEFYKANTYRDIAAAQAEAGRKGDAANTFQRAMTAAATEESNFLSASAFNAIAAASAKAGFSNGAVKGFQRALAAAGSEKSASLRASSYTSIAQNQFEAGQRDAARKTIALAIKAMADLTGKREQEKSLKKVSQVLVKAGEPALTGAVIKTAGAMAVAAQAKAKAEKDARDQGRNAERKKEQQKKKAINGFTKIAEEIRAKPALVDTKSYLATLGRKKPPEIVLGIAATARDMADVLGRLLR